jgi:hypothetical protein
MLSTVSRFNQPSDEQLMLFIFRLKTLNSSYCARTCCSSIVSGRQCHVFALSQCYYATCLLYVPSRSVKCGLCVYILRTPSVGMTNGCHSISLSTSNSLMHWCSTVIACKKLIKGFTKFLCRVQGSALTMSSTTSRAGPRQCCNVAPADLTQFVTNRYKAYIIINGKCRGVALVYASATRCDLPQQWTASRRQLIGSTNVNQSWGSFAHCNGRFMKEKWWREDFLWMNIQKSISSSVSIAEESITCHWFITVAIGCGNCAVFPLKFAFMYYNESILQANYIAGNVRFIENCEMNVYWPDKNDFK